MIQKLILLFSVVLPTLCYAHDVDWQVVNRFPLFEYAEDFQRLEKAFEKQTDQAGLKTVVDFFSTALVSNQALREMMPIHRTAWNADKGEYDKTILFKDTHQVRFKLVGHSHTGDCTWRINQAIRIKACDEPLFINIKENEPFTLIVTDNDGNQWQLNEPEGIKTKFIVGLGDSFASGEGSPDHPTIFKTSASLTNDWFLQRKIDVIERNAEWWDTTCHRSLLSWQSLYALKASIINNHSVVRFVSFACSGAQIYDGYFNPQTKLPGGYRLRPNPMSQHNALMDLICDEGNLYLGGKTFRSGYELKKQQNKLIGSYDQSFRITGPAGQPYFGEIKNYANCNGELRKVDELLLSFGGNDLGFSGVVTWALAVNNPNNNAGGLLKVLRSLGVYMVNFIKLKPISPSKAAESLVHLRSLYSDLYQSISEFKLDSHKVVALVYPDPLPSYGENDLDSDFTACRDIIRDGNLPLSLIANKMTLGFGEWKFGIGKSDANNIRAGFINPFRSELIEGLENITREGSRSWSILDANLIYQGNEENLSKTICSTSNTCNEYGCENANKLTWIKKPSYSPIPKIKKFEEFFAYDSKRGRGLVLSSDALLTQARLNDIERTTSLHDDWMNGLAHPTAFLHAALADVLFKKM